MIRLDDILHFLVSRSAAPSSFGAQLDRMRTGTSLAPDPFRARDEAEATLLEQARILRCVDHFTARQEFRPANFRVLERVQKHSPLHPPQGLIAIQVLRAYQEWATNSQERALVAVYQCLSRISPLLVPPPPKNEPDLTMAFRSGKAKRARDMSAEVYADALLALGSFLTAYNRASLKLV